MTQLLLSPERTADVLGIGRTKVYELIGANAIETVKIGASRRIPMDALTAYVAALRTRGPEGDTGKEVLHEARTQPRRGLVPSRNRTTARSSHREPRWRRRHSTGRTRSTVQPWRRPTTGPGRQRSREPGRGRLEGQLGKPRLPGTPVAGTWPDSRSGIGL